MVDAAKPLKDFRPKHSFFIGIDSDGCAFDTMEIKQKECFLPNTIKHWKLQSVSKYARQTSEFVNLYSKWRGVNRWPAIIKVFDLLRERPEVIKRGVEVPQAQAVRDWMERESKLGNPALQAEVEKTGDPVLAQGLAWSEAVNATIADMVQGVGPFPLVRETLERAGAHADMMVVSQTPVEALTREWEEHDIAKYVVFIAGQEMGTKTEHLAFAAKGKYEPNRVLMIGDAPGDMKAAQGNDALFFPINPGDEEQSWQNLYEEGLERFFSGTFAGQYEAELIRQFDEYLPEKAPWQS